jgi:hypothetical protein
MKIQFLLLVSAVLSVVGGCGGRKMKFNNQEEAAAYVLTCMEERYGEEFVIMGEERYTTYTPFSLQGDAYGCQVAPKSDTEKVAWANVTQIGYFIDDWAGYYFKDEVEEEVSKVVGTQDVKIDELYLEATLTATKWEEADGAEAYLKGSGAYVKIDARCENGLSLQEYSRQLQEFLEPVYQLKVNTEVVVFVGNTYIFFQDINTLGENKTTPFTIEELEEQIMNNASSSLWRNDELYKALGLEGKKWVYE